MSYSKSKLHQDVSTSAPHKGSLHQESFILTQIGVVHSCYKEKFGIPRTSNLVDAARGEVELFSPWGVEDALRDLEGISHIWISFKFHQNKRTEFSPTVRPPRSGGNQQVGVYATRSPVRPNPLGLSVVRYFGHTCTKGGSALLHIGGQDIVEGTPVYDIKPYIAESDMILSSTSGWVDSIAFSEKLEVVFTDDSLQKSKMIEMTHPHFTDLVTQSIGADPRPAYKRVDGEWGMRLYDYNIRWRVCGTCAEVFLVQ